MQDASDLQRQLLQKAGIEICLPNLGLGVRALTHLQRWSECIARSAFAGLETRESDARPGSEREALE